MALLFETTRNNVTLHIGNIFKEGELDENSVCKESLLTASDGKSYRTKIYNLDVIISVGYRVRSRRGTQFRIWANKVLKDYLLRGYAINQRFEQLEQRVSKTEEKIDFFVRTSLPPVEGVFFDGQIFDAYVFATDLIKTAKKDIVLIDNYIDESVLLMLSKRNAKVHATIITQSNSRTTLLDIEKYNAQYTPIEIKNSDFIQNDYKNILNSLFKRNVNLISLFKRLNQIPTFDNITQFLNFRLNKLL